MDFWGHQRKNLVKCQTNLHLDAFIIKTGLRIISDFVNWIRVMQVLTENFNVCLCTLMSQ